MKLGEDFIKPVVWVGDALKRVKLFPPEVRQDIGAALFDVQKGAKPPSAKPLRGVSSGVLEIVTRFDTDTYRTVYAVQIGQQVYVLHAFQKKAPKGRKTAKLDLEMIERRYKEAVAIEKEKNS
ncbi:MAG: hypothetical protein COW89_02490 [Nitrospinae bacterium CG22_combo_CG10-13_8_21_14_all_47_10]|nr:MAG: hypothetical protein COW89_02490 [Nitrospinae bacterium CG22_combo_CG10-13_8_21_14_all_47_10]